MKKIKTIIGAATLSIITVALAALFSTKVYADDDDCRITVGNMTIVCAEDNPSKCATLDIPNGHIECKGTRTVVIIETPIE
jgi:hypothetical protein